MALTKSRILDALSHVHDPATGSDIVSNGFISGLVLRDGNVGFSIDPGSPDAAARMEPVRAEAEAAVRALDGVLSVTAVLTAEREGGQADAPPPPPQTGRRQPQTLAGIEQVGAIVAVASGKGGVGKSTVAANLAVALARQGLATGLLDADIYGPSVPRLMGLVGKQPESDGKRLTPLDAHGVRTMSIGYLVDESKAMVWRGPMVVSAITQLLGDVDWGKLDVLIVDMPPGTGDAQLTMAQRVPLAGAVIVSTPQDIALIDARKGIAMFQQVDVPILGLVENMSAYICPHCGETSHIFGHGGARTTAESMDIPFLGEIPLHIRIRETSDAGTPIVAAHPDDPQAQAFMDAASAMRAALGAQDAPAAPKISIS